MGAKRRGRRRLLSNMRKHLHLLLELLPLLLKLHLLLKLLLILHLLLLLHPRRKLSSQ